MKLEGILQSKVNQVSNHLEDILHLKSSSTDFAISNDILRMLSSEAVSLYTDLYPFVQNPFYSLEDIRSIVKSIICDDKIEPSRIQEPSNSSNLNKLHQEGVYFEGFQTVMERLSAIGSAMRKDFSNLEEYRNLLPDFEIGKIELPRRDVERQLQQRSIYSDLLSLGSRLQVSEMAILNLGKDLELLDEDSPRYGQIEFHRNAHLDLCITYKEEEEFLSRLLKLTRENLWALDLALILCEYIYAGDGSSLKDSIITRGSNQFNSEDLEVVTKAINSVDVNYIRIPGYENSRNSRKGGNLSKYIWGKRENPRGIWRALKKIDIDPIWNERIIEHHGSIEKWHDNEMFVTPLSQVNSPFVAKVEPSVKDEYGNWYLVEELYSETLEELLGKEGKLNLETALSLGIQICEGLKACHAKEILHLDLKPGNVGISSEGHAKLSDFGSLESMSFGTKTGDILNICYSPSSAIEGQKLNKESNLFGAALITYKMLTGENPFEPEIEKEGQARVCSSIPL